MTARGQSISDDLAPSVRAEAMGGAYKSNVDAASVRASALLGVRTAGFSFGGVAMSTRW
jgi:hypothetical protein